MKTTTLSTHKNINYTKKLWNYSLADIYKIVKTGTYNYNDLKQKTAAIQSESDHGKQNAMKVAYMPYACINGRFSERADDKLIEYSCFTAIDFDRFTTEEELENIGYWLTQTPCVRMLFRSPSGKGLKAIVEHTNTNPQKHRALYSELLDMFNISEVDTRTSDLSRATFLCYDPWAWWNPNCIPYKFDEFKYPEDVVCKSSIGVSLSGNYSSKVSQLNDLSCDPLNITDGSIKRIISAWLDRETILEGERNNMLFKYGCKLCKAGVIYDYGLDLLLEVFTGLGLSEEEVMTTACNAYCKCYNEFGVDRGYYCKKGNRNKKIVTSSFLK